MRRGDIKHAFGFNNYRVNILVADGTFVAAKYPFGKTRSLPGGRIVANRAHFLRSQVLAVAKRWEGEA